MGPIRNREILGVDMLQRSLVVLIVFLATGAQAQWLSYPTPGTPRTRDGKPNLSAKAPRASNGRPDLSGVWQTEFAPAGENERLFGDEAKTFAVLGDDPRNFPKYFLNILVDFKPGASPLRPEFAELFRKNSERRATESPRRPVSASGAAARRSHQLCSVQNHPDPRVDRGAL